MVQPIFRCRTSECPSPGCRIPNVRSVGDANELVIFARPAIHEHLAVSQNGSVCPLPRARDGLGLADHGLVTREVYDIDQMSLCRIRNAVSRADGQKPAG